MKKTLKYILQYDTPEFAEERRAVAQSGKNKADYMVRAMLGAGFGVQIVSAAWTANSHGRFKKRHVNIDEGIDLIICPTFGARLKVMRLLRMFFALGWLFWYLIFNTGRGDIVFSYHDLTTARSVMWAKRLKKFKLILEVNEKYTSVSKGHKLLDDVEEKVIRAADGYVFINNEANRYFGTAKPFAVSHGSYLLPLEYPKINDGKIHVLYAGIIDTVKAGAFSALKAAALLDERYVLHIIGTGKDKDVEALKKAIESFSGACGVTYDGMKIGEEYIKYASSMHIGLSTQSAEGEYLKYSFPSKILSYLGMNLRVISGRLECVTTSKVNSLMYYYDDDTPESVAAAIIAVDLSGEYDSRSLLRQLDADFSKDLKRLIAEVTE